jgi:uncharacterized coiled-coil protein SlyX
MTHSDPEQSGNAGEASLANRLGDLEFKLAFLERELEKWKDAVDGLHARLERGEAELRATLRELRGGDGQSLAGGDAAAGSEPESGVDS